MAMANRMAVISTPYHFALEVVQDNRGVIIPYKDQNSTLLAKAICALLEDATLREEMVCFAYFDKLGIFSKSSLITKDKNSCTLIAQLVLMTNDFFQTWSSEPSSLSQL